MGTSVRGSAAWAAMLSLLAGFLLPSGPGPVAADFDGICGPVLALERSAQRVENAPPPARQNHCAYCHWRHSMASASAASLAVIARPSDDRRAAVRPGAIDPGLVVIGALAPRGPPAVS